MPATDSRREWQLERRIFHPLKVPAVPPLRELADPQAVAILDRGLGPRAAHRCAGLELFENVLRDPFSFFDCLRCRDELRQLLRTIVSALRRVRPSRGPEAQVTRAILRSMQQVIDFLQV